MNVARVATISRVLVEEGLGWLTEASPPADAPASASEAEVAKRLRRALERLGPTFVKFGQMLATRVDLFGEAFVAELAQLQTSVAPFPAAEARQILAAELGRPAEEVFDGFPEAPVAAASIAQVYRARLRDGAEVAVKVQRPGLDESLLSDLDTLLTVSGMFDRLVPPYHRAMVHRIAQEYALRARSELDFRAEAQAIERFGEVLRTLPEFRVPGLHANLCTGRVLVMEWIEGTRLSDVADPVALTALGFEPEAFCRSMLKLQLSMAYEHGFLHGDTHPGNLILEPTTQKVAILDFGLHGHVPRQLREKMLEIVFCQASGKPDEAVEAFVQVFRPEPGVDLDAFKAELKPVLAQAGRPGALKDQRVTDGLVKGMRVGARHRLQAQSDLFLVIRNLTIVEGIVLKYCPTLDANAEVRTITGGILRRRLFGPQMQEEFDQLLPQLALTLSQRPRFAERLLSLERAFTESRSLGVFLEQQGVLRPAPPAADRPWVWLILGLALGVGLGLLLGR